MERSYCFGRHWLAGVLVALMVLTGCAPGCGLRPGQPDAQNDASRPAAADPASVPAAQQRRDTVDIFAFGRVLGTIAPCGCTSDPLGGLEYTFGLLEESSRPGHRVIVEPGSFLFPDPDGPHAPTDEASWAQTTKRADILHGRFSALGDALVGGLGPTDLSSASGKEALGRWPLPRVLANIATDARDDWPTIAPIQTVKLGTGVEVAVTAVVDPAAAASTSAFPPLTDPLAAARAAVTAFDGAGAQIRILIVHGTRELAETIATKVNGFDLVVMGGQLGERGKSGASAARIGGAWLIEPGDQTQTVAHVRLSIRADAANVRNPADQWAVIPVRSVIEAQKARVSEQLARFRADKAADPSFLRRLERELGQLDKQLSGEAAGPPDHSAAVSVTFEQVKITCRIAADAKAKAALEDYGRWVATENKRLFAGVRPPAPGKGESTYVGTEECGTCHDEAEEFWNETRHAGAFETLEQANKQYDLSCVGCHVTGFRRPGGSEIVENQPLRDVQCEQCHGPGSKHAEDPVDKRDRPLHIEKHAPAKVCVECHTPEHSDTFDYEPYLRDILGSGHGAQASKALGEGPTGAELRAAAIKKAGGKCKAM